MAFAPQPGRRMRRGAEAGARRAIDRALSLLRYVGFAGERGACVLMCGHQLVTGPSWWVDNGPVLFGPRRVGTPFFRAAACPCQRLADLGLRSRALRMEQRRNDAVERECVGCVVGGEAHRAPC